MVWPQLEEADLLTHTTRLRKATLSPPRQTKVNRYQLHEPFAQYTVGDILNEDVITASLHPLPPKKRPGKPMWAFPEG